MQSVSFGTENDTGLRIGRLVEITAVAGRIVREHASVSPGDNVAIIYDHEVSPLIVEALAGQAYSMGGTPILVRMIPQSVHGAEPPAPVGAALAVADLIYAVVSKSISHTNAVRDAVKSHARYLGFSNITEDSFIHGAAEADPVVLQDVGSKVQSALSGSREVRVTSDLGTDVTFSIGDRSVKVGDSVVPPRRGSLKGEFDFRNYMRMFPDGEVTCCPLEESVNGTIVVDKWIQGIGVLEQPVTWEFLDGVCIQISGGPEADMLNRLLDSQGDEYSHRLGEFAVGINPMARVDGNPHREGKKIFGSCHFALGTGKTTGGIYQSTIHLDGLLVKPVIVADGTEIFARSEFKLA